MTVLVCEKNHKILSSSWNWIKNQYILYIQSIYKTNNEMKIYTWSKEKNEKLQLERWVCFEEIVEILQDWKEIKVIKHFNTEKYPNQNIAYIEIRGYVYAVPFLEIWNEIRLITIYPTRKGKKLYLDNK